MINIFLEFKSNVISGKIIDEKFCLLLQKKKGLMHKDVKKNLKLIRLALILMHLILENFLIYLQY